MTRNIKLKKDYTGHPSGFAGVKQHNNLPTPTTEFIPNSEVISYPSGTVIKVEVMDTTATHTFIDLAAHITFQLPDSSYYEFVD